MLHNAKLPLLYEVESLAACMVCTARRDGELGCPLYMSMGVKEGWALGSHCSGWEPIFSCSVWCPALWSPAFWMLDSPEIEDGVMG